MCAMQCVLLCVCVPGAQCPIDAQCSLLAAAVSWAIQLQLQKQACLVDAPSCSTRGCKLDRRRRMSIGLPHSLTHQASALSGGILRSQNTHSHASLDPPLEHPPASDPTDAPAAAFTRLLPTIMASHFAHQTQQSPSLQQAYNGGATASLYGPALSRTRASDAESIAQARSEYDSQMAAMDAQRDAANRSALAAEWERTNGQVARPAAFYNTREGDELIAAARLDLARSKPAAAATANGNGTAHLASVHDNRQRVFHNDCVLAQNIALEQPKSRAAFQQFPLQGTTRHMHCTRRKDWF